MDHEENATRDNPTDKATREAKESPGRESRPESPEQYQPNAAQAPADEFE